MDALIARLALARGWISQESYHRILARMSGEFSSSELMEDILRAEGLSGEQLGTLRGALQIPRKEPWMGDWRLVRRIGVGGMGSVFEARHRRTGRRAALKVLLPRLGHDPEFTSRFLHEARALARISHPNVVHAFDAGNAGEFYFIAMELVDGEDLRELLLREGCLAPVRSAEVALGVARALSAIESAGLVHRDVKPANILIDVAGVIKLADLGLFHDDLDPRIIWDGAVFGTPQYMSPEQVLGHKEIDIRSDLYSLGATWYHALIGRPPFEGDAPERIAQAQVEALPEPPAGIRPDVPLAMERLILTLLEKDPSRRPPNAMTLAREIEGILGSPAAKRKPTETARLRKRDRWKIDKGFWRGRIARFLFFAFPFLLGVVFLSRWGIWTGRERPPTSERKIPSVQPAGDGEDHTPVHAVIDSAVSSVRDLALRVSRVSRQVVSRALPRFPGWTAFPRGEESAEGPSSDSPRGKIPSPAVAGVQEKTAVIEWAARGAEEARLRFRRALSKFRGREAFEVVLRDGSSEYVQVALAYLPALNALDGRPVPLEILHPATLIVWASLDLDDPIPDGGVGLAISEGYFRGAQKILEVLSPVIPGAVRKFITRSSAGKTQPMAVADAFLSRGLRAVFLEREIRNHFQSGRFREAADELRVLLDLEENFPLSVLKRSRWSSMKNRFQRISHLKESFSTGTVAPLDPLQGEIFLIQYLFQEDRELRDFRFSGPAWALEDGSLTRKSPGRGLKQDRPERPAILKGPLDTVAIFALPVTVKGAWSAPWEMEGRIVVGFADRFVALSAHSILESWRGEFEDGELPEVGGRIPARGRISHRFQVKFFQDRTVVEIPGQGRTELPFDPPSSPTVPPLGRLTFGLDPDGALEKLSLIGLLDPVWAEARILERKRLEGK